MRKNIKNQINRIIGTLLITSLTLTSVEIPVYAAKENDIQKYESSEIKEGNETDSLSLEQFITGINHQNNNEIEYLSDIVLLPEEELLIYDNHQYENILEQNDSGEIMLDIADLQNILLESGIDLDLTKEYQSVESHVIESEEKLTEEPYLSETEENSEAENYTDKVLQTDIITNELGQDLKTDDDVLSEDENIDVSEEIGVFQEEINLNSVEESEQIPENKISLDDLAEQLNASISSNDSGNIVISKEYQTCEIIVKSSEVITDDNAVAIVGPYKQHYYLRYEDDQSAREACERFSQLSGVIYAVPNKVQKITGNTYDNLETWGYEEIGFENIENKITEKYGDTVSDVVIAVVDTGLDFTHPLFEGRIAGQGIDIVNGDEDATDDNFHGTAVAGVIVSNTPDYIKVLPVKAGNADGMLTEIDIYNGIEYAVEQKVDIINMSFGNHGDHPVEYDAIQDADKAGILLVAAYGNEAWETNDVYPAGFEETIAVTSVDPEQTISAFSNYGPAVDVCAPGRDVYTAVPLFYGDQSGYQYMYGTSFSCPFTAAALGMMKAYEPELSAKQLRKKLTDNAIELGDAGWDKYYGFGMISFDQYEDKGYVAAVGSEKFQSLPEAIASVSENGTIVLWGDAVIDASITIDKNVTIAAAKKQIIQRADNFKEEIFQVTDGAELTLGSLDSMETTLILDGCTIENAEVDSLISIANGSNCNIGNQVIIQNNNALNAPAIKVGGSLQLYKAEFTNNTNIEDGGDISLQDGAELIVKDQAIVDSGICLAGNSTIVVEAALSIVKTPYTISCNAYEIGRSIVTFGNGIDVIRNLFQLSDKDYSLETDVKVLKIAKNVEAGKTVQIGDSYYEGLKEAVAASVSGDIIRINRDIEINEEIRITKPLTILAEKETWLQRADGYLGTLICVEAGGELTLGTANNMISDNQTLIYISGHGIKAEDGTSLIKVENEGSLSLNAVGLVGYEGGEGGLSAIYNEGNLYINGSVMKENHNVSQGGGMNNNGYCLIDGATIINNSALVGGGIVNSGQMQINDIDVIANHAISYGYGGGIANLLGAELTMENGNIEKNDCEYFEEMFGAYSFSGHGGGLWNQGTVTINGGRISDNYNHTGGAGIYNAAERDGDKIFNVGMIEFNDGEISNNVSEYLLKTGEYSAKISGYGGGILNSGIFYLNAGLVKNNKARSDAGGIYNANEFIMSGGTIENNYLLEAEDYGRFMQDGLPEEIMCTFDSHTKLIGGTLIHDNEKGDAFYPEVAIYGKMDGVIGEKALFEMGGDFSWKDSILFQLVGTEAKISICEAFAQKQPIAYLLASDNKKDNIFVTYKEGLTPELEPFREEFERILKIEGQNLVFEDESSEPSVPPSEEPSQAPSVSASAAPSEIPSTAPSEEPSSLPDILPSKAPEVDVTVSISMNDIENKEKEELNKIAEEAVTQTVENSIPKGLDYNGGKQTVDLNLTIDGVQLAEGTDYVIKYKNAVNAGGEARMEIKFLGDYKKLGTVTKEFSINALDIAGDDFAAADLYYVAGKSVKPAPVLYYKGKKLKAGKDFTFDTAKIAEDIVLTLTGCGNFTGTRDINVIFIDKEEETRTSLSKAKIAISKKLVFEGSLVEPAGEDFVVSIGSGKNKVILERDVDYTVEFSSNDRPGAAVAVIRSLPGSEYCYGNKTVTFKLAGAKISKAKVTLLLTNEDGMAALEVGTKKGTEAAYTGSAICPSVKVSITNPDGSTTVLREGIDYTLSYKKNRKKGTATVTVTGIGAYTGTKTVKFKIK